MLHPALERQPRNAFRTVYASLWKVKGWARISADVLTTPHDQGRRLLGVCALLPESYRVSNGFARLSRAWWQLGICDCSIHDGAKCHHTQNVGRARCSVSREAGRRRLSFDLPRELLVCPGIGEHRGWSRRFLWCGARSITDVDGGLHGDQGRPQQRHRSHQGAGNFEGSTQRHRPSARCLPVESPLLSNPGRLAGRRPMAVQQQETLCSSSNSVQDLQHVIIQPVGDSLCRTRLCQTPQL